MFEQYAVFFWAVLFTAVLLYSVWRIVVVPHRVRRFYAQLGFRNDDKPGLRQAPYLQSVLLRHLDTEQIFSGQYRHQAMQQFAAFADSRGKFTLDRATRNQNKLLWTITILHSDRPIVDFCARPVRASNALEYVLDTGNVQFAEDEFFSDRVHVLATDHQAVQAAFKPPVRDYLNHIDPVSLESIDHLLILKTPRQPHDTGSVLKAQLDTLSMLQQTLTEA